MTEDDTFKKLSRTPLTEMLRLYGEQNAERINKGEKYSSLNNLKFAKLHNWEWSELLHEIYEYRREQNIQ